ncbi:MAG: CNNM domain-containing protein [Planctomycetota bacterium]|jgi:CBS domain containing-hemolysin-like protein
MIWLALVLGAIGLFLSAFFSGSETGFYRVTRMRLVLDALGGDPVARGLLWLTNHPSLFVATTLVGNNLANFLMSLAIVMGVSQYGPTAEMIAPLAMAPLLFVYGELLPKNLFLHAPNRLLRIGGPLFLVFVVLFLPVSGLLWLLNRLFSRLAAESPEHVRLTLARRELRQALEEGHEAGILRPSQVELARGIFAVAKQPVTQYATPIGEVTRARADMSKDEVCRLARRLQIPDIPVEHADGSSRLLGYVRVIDLGLDSSEDLGPLRPLLRIPHSDSHVDALMRMHGAGETLGEVVDEDGKTVGLVTARRLREPLLHSRR